jgi:putative tryptophan/tyrosine transport system substrate-binding protein
MRRREFIAGLGSAAAWPVVARAQKAERVPRVGVLATPAANDPEFSRRVAAFLQGLQELGWTDGRNLRIEYRFGAADVGRIRRYAAELVALMPDVILATSGLFMGPLLEATRALPIVFVAALDPVGAGYVASLARPGGNATGFSVFEHGIGTKWLELLKQIAPSVTRVAVIRNATLGGGAQLGAIQAVAPSFGVEWHPIDPSDAAEMERAITEFARPTEWRPYRDRERDRAVSSRSDHRACGTVSFAFGLPLPHLHPRRRPDLLRCRHGRSVPQSSRLRRSHPLGGEAG